MATTKELITDRFNELKAEAEILEASVADLRAEREQYLAQIAAYNARVRELTEQIRSTIEPRASELAQEIATVAGALGGYSLARGG